jgi:hypothetical protein
MSGRAKPENVAVWVYKCALVLAPFGVLGHVDLGACSPPYGSELIASSTHR